MHRREAGGKSPCGDLNEGAPPHGLRLRLAVGVAFFAQTPDWASVAGFLLIVLSAFSLRR